MYPGQCVPSNLFCEEPLDVTHAQRYSVDHDDVQLIYPDMNDDSVSSTEYTLLSMRSPARESAMCRSHHLPNVNLTPWYTSPRVFSIQSTPSHGRPTYLHMISSPSPLSRDLTLLYPDFSPPFQGNTPLERQFVSDPAYPEYISFNTELSPVARKDPFHSSQSSFTDVPTDATPLCNDDPQTSELFSATEHVSLIEKFKSVTRGPDGESPKPPRSPISEASSLTPLSSPGLFCGRRAPRGTSTPPTSPVRNSVRGVTKTAEPHCPIREQQVRPGPPPAHLTEESSKHSGDSGRKRKLVSADPYFPFAGENCHERKKPRPPNETDAISTLRIFECSKPTRRHLPAGIPYHPQFALFYRRFPVSSRIQTADGIFVPLSSNSEHPGGLYNPPRGALDMYTPRFVRGCGATKVGLCPVCFECPSRGGRGQCVWLSMKFSAYNYHMQYGHGISAVSCTPFSPPVSFRTTKRRNPGKRERTHIVEGKCHKCKKWIPIESLKDLEIKVKEIYWWKHAAACHQGAQIKGDDDFFKMMTSITKFGNLVCDSVTPLPPQKKNFIPLLDILNVFFLCFPSLLLWLVCCA
ncbi:hypothetical protein F5141DRAFT_371747 [Pisolithus sp. B1]|nr:hypothetical protein F5141DRAFT_371747 [Pisolithus sp. B1]